MLSAGPEAGASRRNPFPPRILRFVTVVATIQLDPKATTRCLPSACGPFAAGSNECRRSRAFERFTLVTTP